VDAPYPNEQRRLDFISTSFERFQQECERLFAFLFLVALVSQRDFWELLESSKWSRTKVHDGLYNVHFLSQFAINWDKDSEPHVIVVIKIHER
jgi:hypothetical protein